MRQFLVVGHDAPTSPDFSLDDLPGSAGRLDLLARCLIDGLLTSHGIREDTRVWLVLGDALSLRFDGASLRNLHPDERSAAALVRSALGAREEAIGHQPVAPSPGVELRKRGFAATLAALAEEGSVLELARGGTGLGEAAVPTDPVFVLSDHREFTSAEREVLEDHVAYSLGPVALHANQAITVAHNWLDTGGFQSY